MGLPVVVVMMLSLILVPVTPSADSTTVMDIIIPNVPSVSTAGYSSTPLIVPQQLLPLRFGHLLVFFQLFFPVVVFMVEHFSQHPHSISLIQFVVLHVRVPHKICHFIGHHHFSNLSGFGTNEQKLYVVAIAVLVS